VPVTTITANYTIVASTDFTILCNATGQGTVTITLPSVASNVGRVFVVKQINALNGSTDHCVVTPVGTVGGTGSITLDAPSLTSTNTYSSFWFVSDGSKWWAVSAGP